MNEFQFLHASLEADDDIKKISGTNFTGSPDIYMVEDDQVFGKTIKRYLEKKLNIKVHYYTGPASCIADLDKKLLKEGENKKPFCLVSDISFDEGSVDGLLLIDLLKDRGHDFVSIVMTGFASIETAILATKKGVFHYLTKPFDLSVLSDLIIRGMISKFDLDESIFKSTSKINYSDMQGERGGPSIISKFKIEVPNKDDIFCGMIGRSKAMKQVFERISLVAASDSTVLITGPSGTGKELVAKAIHKMSPRNGHSNISVNCGAIPSELLESELFGHVKGSFTGAISDRKGRFELANFGTIFLDEIGDMPFLLQVKLLRVLQGREIERVGGSVPFPVDVRIITATHHDLEKSVEEGRFREDLFYRLNVIPIKIPPLSGRREDIPLLMSYFLSRFVSADGRNNITFEDDTLEMLMGYDWPGNVRELENLMERLVILRGGDIIRVTDLPAKFLIQNPSYLQKYNSLITLTEDGVDIKQILADIEDSLIHQAIELTNGNKNQASKLLNLNRTTLIEKMKKKGIRQ